MSMPTATGPVRERAAVPAPYTWDLSPLYPDLAAWRARKAEVVADLPSIRTFEGRLASSPAVLADALERLSSLDKELSRLHMYASAVADEDTRAAEPHGMQQEMQQIYAQFAAHAAYLEPEVLRGGSAWVEAAIAAEPRLTPYAFYLRDVARRASHTLGDAEERLLADAGPMAGAASNIYTILTNADFPYPTITLADGSTMRIDQAGYTEVRSSPVRDDRRAGMAAFFGALGGFGRTLGTTMSANLQKALFYARARKYGSSLEAALDGSNVPVSVYTRLVEGVNRHIGSLHRYLRLRARMMDLADGLRYHDLYAPLVASVDLRYTPEEAQAHVLDAMAPLGPEYVEVLARAFRDRWIDWYPSEGKVSGAYSNGGAYDVHPYMLLNYLGHYNDVSTLAHELGHTMHSYYSNATQPYASANYPMFVAEVASTFNEALLIERVLSQTTDTPTRLALLGNALEGFKATVFRQTQFAEFELRMHEMAQRGEPVTGESLDQLYLGITRRYYGHDAGICHVDDVIAHEWSFIPHFYREFYVYQYATSFTAAEALSAHVRGGDEDARARYLRFLSSGGSDYPIALLAKAGVDMTTDGPLDLTMANMNRLMDEIEGLIA
jgi:oligoendopeptidase F